MQDHNILIMNHRYPFDPSFPSSSPTNLTLVKLRRRFQSPQHLPLKSKIHTHYNITHPSIIRISKAFESKKKKYFDIFFEWVPTTFRSQARYLSYAELQEKKLQLLSLCSYLINIHIHPIITEDLIGITREKEIKLYVDVDYSPIVGSVQELVRAKEIEISNIFKLYERVSLFESPRVEEVRQVNSNEIIYVQKEEEIVGHGGRQIEGERYKQMLNNYGMRQEPLNSPIGNKDRGNLTAYRQVQPVSLINQINQSQNQIQNTHYGERKEHQISISGKIIYEVKEEGSFKSSSKLIMGEGNSMNKSGNQYKLMKPEKDSGTNLEMLLKQYNMYNNNNHDNNIIETHIQTQQQSKASNPLYRSYQPQQQLRQPFLNWRPQIPPQHIPQNQMLRQPRLFQVQQQNYHQIFQQEQISIVDTYKEELGSQKKMPKIRNSEFRQTTKEPPTIVPFIVPTEEKSRMSAGNNSWENDFKSDRLPMMKYESEEKREREREREKQKNEEGQIKSPRSDYKLENGYYYQEAFGFGFQKNDPLTREFISLFEDGNVGGEQQSERVQSVRQELKQQEIVTVEERQVQRQEEFPESNMEQINKKVRSALENSMKTLEMFQKLKITSKQ